MKWDISRHIKKIRHIGEIKGLLCLFFILFFVGCSKVGKVTPTLSSVSPSTGNISGGTLVTIAGSNLRFVTSVNIGGSPCIIQSLIPTQITCLTPAKSIGTYDVTVTTQNKESATLPAAFFYSTPPVFSSVSPYSGFATGGTAVTITGSGFASGATVSFGGSVCNGVTVVNSSTITCTTSAHASGSVAVTVTNIDGQSASGVGFIYRGPPTVTGISPIGGSLSGGTLVTISGTGFYAGTTIVDFGGSSCTGVTVVSSTKLTCTTTSHIAGTVLTTVTNADTQSGTGTYFTYGPGPTVTSVSPNQGAIGGGTSVTITGTNFISGATVTFGSSACTGALVLSSTSIICTTPMQLTTGAVNVKVTNPDTQSGTLTNGYTYNLAPTVTSVSPNAGFSSGATAVTITGTGFNSGATVSFGGSACNSVTVVSATSITCITSAHAAGAVSVSVTNTDTQSGSAASAYTYRAPPTVTGVSLNAGALGGGTNVTITGTGFYPGSTVDFGGSICGSVNVVSATSLTCTTTAHAAGAVTVTVTNADTQSGNMASAYTYQAAPTVTSVTSSSGPLAGGSTVTLTGTGFLSGATVKFGANTCTLPVVISATSIQCTTPSSLTSGAVNVTVTNADTQSGTLTNGYIYIPAPTVTSVALNAGALGGGTNVTITGTGFIAGATVDFSGSNCGTVTVVSSTSITCTTSAHAAGAVTVKVTNTDLQFGSAINAYTYQTAPTVTSVSLNAGALGGGTSVTVTGTGFVSGATVDFGGSACSSPTVVSSTSLTCTTTSHAAGAVTVTVTNADTQSGSAASAYTYQAAPTVTSISPTSGFAVGGTSVTVTGTGFISGASVSLGGSNCGSVTVVSATSITCTTTAHAAGIVNLTVTNADNQSGSLANAFMYMPAPTVTSVTKNAGALGGGTAVTIAGTGFVSGATVSFGGAACTTPTVVSSTTITCTTPAHAAGAVNVVVTNTDTQSGTLTNGFTYQAAPTVTSVSLNAGALAGGTAVTITGTGFVSGATVDFGGSACSSPTVVSSTSITCTTSAHAAGAVTVTVTNADTQSGNAASAYTYQAAPTTTSVSLNAGALGGGTSVTVTGTGFLAGATVDFGGSNCGTVTVVSPTSITCTTTAHAAGAVTVKVTNADTQFGSASNAYTYQAAPTVSSVSVANGSINGSTPIIITGTGFLSGATASFGGTNCTSITVVSSTSITCTTAAHAAGVVNVVVTNTDTQSGTLTNGFTYQSMAEFHWVVGSSSPTPPNPDSYGTTSVNVTHTYTLKNTGDITSTAISLSKAGTTPAAWMFGTDNCTGATLAAGATCTVQVTFLAQYLTTGSYSALLSGTASGSNTTSNSMTGSVP